MEKGRLSAASSLSLLIGQADYLLLPLIPQRSANRTKSALHLLATIRTPCILIVASVNAQVTGNLFIQLTDDDIFEQFPLEV
jgi:hypothetical protein